MKNIFIKVKKMKNIMVTSVVMAKIKKIVYINII